MRRFASSLMSMCRVLFAVDLRACGGAQALGNGDETDQLVHGFRMTLTREDMRVLRPDEWLKDGVVNFYLELVRARHARHVHGPAARRGRCEVIKGEMCGQVRA
jgi:hypothetical protein